MNSPLSDGNESTIDIFVLSTSTTESPVQAGHLERIGYRITYFTDGKQLFESFRSGKPNLLICDTVRFRKMHMISAASSRQTVISGLSPS